MRDSSLVNDYDFLIGIKVKHNNKDYVVSGTWKVNNTNELYISLEYNKTWLNMRASEVVKKIYEDITKTKC